MCHTTYVTVVNALFFSSMWQNCNRPTDKRKKGTGKTFKLQTSHVKFETVTDEAQTDRQQRQDKQKYNCRLRATTMVKLRVDCEFL